MFFGSHLNEGTLVFAKRVVIPLVGTWEDHAVLVTSTRVIFSVSIDAPNFGSHMFAYDLVSNELVSAVDIDYNSAFVPFPLAIWEGKPFVLNDILYQTIGFQHLPPDLDSIYITLFSPNLDQNTSVLNLIPLTYFPIDYTGGITNDPAGLLLDGVLVLTSNGIPISFLTADAFLIQVDCAEFPVVEMKPGGGGGGYA